MSGWFRMLFLFSSFGPLYAVLALGLYVQNHAFHALLAATTAVTSFLVFLKLREGFVRKSPFWSKIDVEAALDESILSYLIAYLPPLLIDDFNKPEKFIPAIGFYFVVITLMLRTDTIYVNPYFTWFGYRIYRVKLASGCPIILVTSRKYVASGDELSLYEMQPSRLYFAN
jgi:hypothetical protein